MKKCLIIGNVNVGKTLFLINFANYIGIKELNIVHSFIDKPDYSKKYTINEAIKQLSSDNMHTTIGSQRINLTLNIGKGKRTLELIDTTGLFEGIHPEENIRKGMAKTLSYLTNSNLILHVMDSWWYQNVFNENMVELDLQISEYARLIKGYCILANKIDIDIEGIGLARIKEQFAGNHIFPISAKEKIGFKGVKDFVRRNI